MRKETYDNLNREQIKFVNGWVRDSGNLPPPPTIFGVDGRHHNIALPPFGSAKKKDKEEGREQKKMETRKKEEK